MFPELLLPKVSYICFAEPLKHFFWRWILQECKRMRNVVLETDIANVRKPVFATLAKGSEELNSNIVQDTSW